MDLTDISLNKVNVLKFCIVISTIYSTSFFKCINLFMHTSKKRFWESLRKIKGLTPRADVISHISDICQVVATLYVCYFKKN